VSDKPQLVHHRQTSAKAAIVLVHGFGGSALTTWGHFPALLAAEASLAAWDVYSIGYSTSLAFDIAGLWAADPAIITLGGLLAAVAGVTPLDGYETLAFMAHSMGGLMMQRGLLSDPTLRGRVSHLLLFGTPSAGLEKASPFAFWKRQVRDMASDGPFIAAVRKQWQTDLGDNLPFTFVTIAGDRDEFVPRMSSLDPFPEAHHRVVYGNHLEIVKPDDANHLGFKVAVKALTGDARSGPFDSARLAIESRDFQRAIQELWPNRAELDDKALVSLALALDSVGRREDAIRLLTDAKTTGTDPLGVLAGRLKRRWLAERRRTDAEQAMALYRQALDLSDGKNWAQAFYHAINCAFMEVAFGSDIGAARDYAARAIKYCELSGVNDVWRHATEGEAYLYLSQPEAALAAYQRAMSRSPKAWQAASMYQQAVRAADLIGDEELGLKLPRMFSQGAPVASHP
jgi:pimeloyl-ACP methyl ester carboxylesterase